MTEALMYLGAIDKNANKISSPIIAEKRKECICPDMGRFLWTLHVCTPLEVFSNLLI